MRRVFSKEEILTMKTIASELETKKKEKKRLNRLEYFLLGGIAFGEALSVIYNMRLNGDISDKEYYTLNEYLSFQKQIGAYHTKEAIMATTFIFGDKTISNEEKAVIWDEIINSGVEEKYIDDLVFSAAVRAYAIKNGYVKVINGNYSKTKSLKK